MPSPKPSEPAHSVPRPWSRWVPAPLQVSAGERLRAALGATLGIGITAALAHALATFWHWPLAWLVAPMGASAVLVFALTSSPMAQPWSVVAGHTVAAVVGWVCSRWIPGLEWATASAVGLAILAMYALRCLHPPAGGTALLVVLAAPLPWTFAVFPVATNALILVLGGVLFHRATGQAYPLLTRASNPEASATPASAEQMEAAAVLELYHRTLNIGRDELARVLHKARLDSQQQRLSTLRCGDIMARHIQTVHASTTIGTALGLLQQHRIKALPVTDAHGALVGIVTMADLARKSNEPDQTVASIMTRQVRVARASRSLGELLPLFGGAGHHHVPIIDDHNTVVGMLTQSDVIMALLNEQTSAQRNPA